MLFKLPHAPAFVQQLVTPDDLLVMTPHLALCLLRLFISTGNCPFTDEQLTELLPFLAGLELPLMFPALTAMGYIRARTQGQMPRFHLLSTALSCRVLMMLERAEIEGVPHKKHLPLQFVSGMIRQLAALPQQAPDRFTQLGNEWQEEPVRWQQFCEFIATRSQEG
jgi:hypothetical protein